MVLTALTPPCPSRDRTFLWAPSQFIPRVLGRTPHGLRAILVAVFQSASISANIPVQPFEVREHTTFDMFALPPVAVARAPESTRTSLIPRHCARQPADSECLPWRFGKEHASSIEEYPRRSATENGGTFLLVPSHGRSSTPSFSSVLGLRRGAQRIAFKSAQQ